MKDKKRPPIRFSDVLLILLLIAVIALVCIIDI